MKAYTTTTDNEAEQDERDPISGERVGYLENITKQVTAAWKEQGDLSSDSDGNEDDNESDTYIKRRKEKYSNKKKPDNTGTLMMGLSEIDKHVRRQPKQKPQPETEDGLQLVTAIYGRASEGVVEELFLEDVELHEMPNNNDNMSNQGMQIYSIDKKGISNTVSEEEDIVIYVNKQVSNRIRNNANNMIVNKIRIHPPLN